MACLTAGMWCSASLRIHDVEQLPCIDWSQKNWVYQSFAIAKRVGKRQIQQFRVVILRFKLWVSKRFAASAWAEPGFVQGGVEQQSCGNSLS